MKSERRKWKKLTFVVIFTTLAFVSVGCASGATLPEEEWNMTFGGTGYDSARAVQQTFDGGYILAGDTDSYGLGDSDVLLVKIDSNGNERWNKTFGGTFNDRARSIQQTADGGYIFVGETFSYGAGRSDFWLVKTDSNGAKQWDKTFGGASDEWAYSVQQTADGGYILAGNTYSYGAGGSDFWLVKTDSIGTMQWDRTFGGTGYDYAYSVQQTADEGYILTGITNSYGAGNWDFWLVKTDSNGTEQWNKTFGGADEDRSYSVKQTSDGGYILAGFTGPYAADSDAWLVKTDSNGTELWNTTFGGLGRDEAHSVLQTPDGGYILAGFTCSYGAGGADVWLVKTDSNGTELWNTTFGGTSGDLAYSIQQTTDGGYIIAGVTYSYGAGSGDFWLIKVKGEPTEPIFDTEPSKNPYPSIMGTHKGEIKPSCNINVSKLYTYSCPGTGGHTESIELYENGELIANGTWDGYQSDWHNITIHNVTGAPYVRLLKSHKYNYTIRTGSYPQIHHNRSLLTPNGWINCSEFIDANGKVYYNWIPAIKLS